MSQTSVTDIGEYVLALEAYFQKKKSEICTCQAAI